MSYQDQSRRDLYNSPKIDQTAIEQTNMSSRSFSIHGKGIKFETRKDIEPYLKQIREIPGGVEEVHFGGNTLGVEPCIALAEVLKETTTLKVRMM